MSEGLSRSILARLAKHARAIGVDPNLVLTRYAVERFLYRLSRSQHADRFVLKGALLLLVWLGEDIRPTRDADLLGFGDFSDDALLTVFRDVSHIEVEPDAMEYLAEAARIELIRPEDAYGGRRVTLDARMGDARLRVQVDIGIGDVVTPEPTWIDYPSLLDMPKPRLRAYTAESVIAEKVHAMVVLGLRNSRLRDFFDIDALAQRTAFDGAALTAAILATFEQRRTPIPSALPAALMSAFYDDADKRAQWRAFQRKIGSGRAGKPLPEIISRISEFVGPPLAACARGEAFTLSWPSGGPWSTGV
ncbi:MAG TPA: nucleotidyl transferase AbiEii/AbiGii toxin family protein [Gemmatimonadaceae bacterium]|nr:nucleotidyl transferase AbiEii/AbiGii toxin family protein [Gemmatimonadaceae bacterium]